MPVDVFGLKNKMKISIIIPTYNAERYITEAIDSVLSQTYKNIEIIVVDDGSTDNTENVLKIYIDQNKITYLKKENGGPASARNLGIRFATGDYTALLDADDTWRNDKLAKQIDFLIRNSLDLVFTDRFFIGAENMKDWVSDYKHSTVHLIRENYITTSSVLIKTEILKQHPFGEDKRLFAVEDFDLWLKLAFKKYKFVYLPEKLTGYRIHPNQISSAKNISNLIHLYKNNIKMTNNYIYKFLLFYMYLKIVQYKFRLKFR